ncbi:MAG: FUSC family protein [Solirubrobacteraceae bacterium]
MTRLEKLFEVKWQGFNLRRGTVFAVVLGLLIIVGVLPHDRRYFLSAIFGALLVALSDPGGNYGPRVLAMAAMAGAGALLTALGFGIGGGPWGFVVLAAFVATSLAGLAVKYGLHRFVSAYLLNIWFIIVLGLPTLLSFGLPGAFQSGLIHTEPWKQALAWLTGAALWVAYTFIMWLARGRVAAPQPAAEIPGDISPRPLTKPMILFAVIRAVAVSIAVAIAFGLQLPNAYWMPIAVIIAMKPDLQQSTFAAVQRVAGTAIGAAVAALVLLTVHNKTVLEVIIVLLFGLAAAIRFVNFAWYTAALAGGLLIAMDVPHPSNFASEGRRILFTLAGVGIAVIVMFLADLLQKHAAKAAPQAPQASQVSTA